MPLDIQGSDIRPPALKEAIKIPIELLVPDDHWMEEG